MRNSQDRPPLSRFIIKDIHFFSSLINPHFPIFLKLDIKNNRIEILNFSFIILDSKLFEIHSLIEDKFCLNSKSLLKYLHILKRNSINSLDIQFSLDAVFLISTEKDIEVEIKLPIFEKTTIAPLFKQNENNIPSFFKVILSKTDLEIISKFLITKSFKTFERLRFETKDNNLFIKKEFRGYNKILMLPKVNILQFCEFVYLTADKFFRSYQTDFVSKLLLTFNDKYLSFEILFDKFEDTYFEWREMRFLE
ncbi:hypothetical protein CDIK_0016 [Cucumispora dikerogammari]|nr:hypothetical protein CDIK_0016 [Cucumispora dikerogammari]